MKKHLITLIVFIFLTFGCDSTPTIAPAVEVDATSEPLPTNTAIPATATNQPEAADAIATEPEPIVEIEEVKEEEEEVVVEAEVEAETIDTPVPAATLHPAEALIESFAEPSQTKGELLILYGQVLDTSGRPVPDTVVEIWQTDANGVYDHPGDSGTAGREMSFQFFGSASTGADGWYAFRTVLPGLYEPRPRHIHFKVKQTGETLLTSQFYFSEDIADVQDEGMFQAIGDSGDLLLLQLVSSGDGPVLANGRIVIGTSNGNGELPLTPSQGEGPYYPLVNLAEYDNDLARLP